MPEKAERNYLTPQVLAFIGRESKEVAWPEPLDLSSLRRYIQASHDQNPLYHDEDFAKNSRYGALIAPPFYLARGFPGTLGEPPVDYAEIPEAHDDPEDDENSTRVTIPGTGLPMNGGTEIEWFRPVYVGDTLYSKNKVRDIQQKTGRSGIFIVVTMERTVKNQRGEIVAISTQTSLRIPR